MTVQGFGIQIISAGILASLNDEQRADLDYCILPDFPSVRKCSVAWREDTDHLLLIKETLQLLREPDFREIYCKFADHVLWIDGRLIHAA